MTGRHLLVVACGAAPAADLPTLITIAQQHGWSISTIATPSASQFIDNQAVVALTGAPPRSDFNAPSTTGSQRVVRKADAVVVAPATYNTINKLALGIADTYAHTVLAELIGLAVPIVIVPFVNAALAVRQPYLHALGVLRDEGIRVLAGPADQWQPHQPGTGVQQQSNFPWRKAFELAASAANPG